ncbi:hypothetical protein [uncultured Psychromonas sp.]|uniref:hypothetical protein n=1 Tax=uncultured Psychromonas sp. TaxID=173974 RepID=UPI002625B773|nr:hypothetical protein [uncultured Psychromonas sp.]
MKLIIHIGTEKTGTTSLQAWGEMNRQLLIDDGVFYSKALGNKDHRKASVYSRLLGLRDDGFDRYNITDKKSHEDFCNQLEISLAEEVKEAKNLGCRVFLVSSEHFHSRIDNIAMVKRAKQLFSPHFDDIEIIAYLRPQADLFQSYLSVVIRNLSISREVINNMWIKDVNYFDYFKLWDRWSSVFENVSFAPFNENKDIIKHVAKLLKININNYPVIKRVNEKLDYKVGVLNFNLNKYIKDNSLKKELFNFYVEKLPCIEPVQISRELASRISGQYKQSNIEFCKSNKNFSINHLEVVTENYPLVGTVDKMFDSNEFFDFMFPIMIRNYIDIYILKCEKKLVEIERAFARKNIKNAQSFSVVLNQMLDELSEANFETPLLSHIPDQLYRLRNNLNKMDIGQ